ncbi:aminodeoxychorismate synthase component I [Paraburkholderia sp. ZP32-5]|uniref:aminodeoxychorismate synthase component I n=1 Tax=Paraburkholderia sp. ZP32-5 TaxID=2883245 RepID=UPI001F27B059|nr:aminodeoxychorismate synthase component I [Paraburkholderia sp. ZP32-5]
MSSTVVRSLPWIEPVHAASLLRNKGGLVFLDSAMRHDNHGRYSYVAVDPFGTLMAKERVAYWNDEPVGTTPLEAIAATLKQYEQPDIPGLPPFQGGAIGYFSYEFGESLEQLPATREPDHGSIPDIELMFYDALCAFDHVEQKAWIISTGFPHLQADERAERATSRANQIEAALAENSAQDCDSKTGICIGRDGWTSNFTQSRYMTSVQEVVDSILAGDIFQANLSQRFTTDLPAGFDTWAFYQRLRVANAAPFAAFIDRGEMAIASSSPERFLKVNGSQVETRPIKGTARRAIDPQEDQAIADELLASEKDRAENLMIVDLLRNDLSRVCLPDSVKTPDLCVLETYSGVHHLVSSVTGVLPSGKTAAELLGVSFPGGSITGAPKIKAMEIISRIEQDQRGVYCGAIGYYSFNCKSDTNIAIRTVLFQNGVASFQAGGGITALSDPRLEYEETLTKAERIFRAFESL